MIDNRPKHLLDQDDYKMLPDISFSVDFEMLPELLRRALGSLGGIQPVTAEMCKAVNGVLRDIPSEEEIKLFNEKETLFQPIFLVLSIANLREEDGVPVATPYALSLMPTSKRDVIDKKNVELIAKLDTQKFINEAEPCYADFDPFTGDRGFFGPLGTIVGGKLTRCFLDELGLVVGQYFLAKSFDPTDVVEADIGLPSGKAEKKYKKHRAKLLYTPFTEIRPRRVWGAQSPIELFLFQELLRRNLAPLLQVLVFEDGSIFPSLYHLWRDVEFRYTPGLITEPDIYFPEQKLAVFCDSGLHHRGKKAELKDARIDENLAKIGIRSVRVPGKIIVEDLKAAANLVSNVLDGKAL
jgi:hypothetical protein